MADPTGPNICHCHAIRCSARAVTRLYDHHLDKAGLSISQFSILSLLDHNPGIRILELARLMVMERTTAVRALKPLQQAGLVMAEAADGSRTLGLSLSRQGKRKLVEANRFWQAAQAEFERTFGRDLSVRLQQANIEIAHRVG